MDRDAIMDQILDIEWEMFTNVNNADGKASCQMDRQTFLVMRTSQYAGWDEVLLASYLEDLRSAQHQGRNLMTEKYGRMMQTTFPEEYARIADFLPPLDPAAAERIEEIVTAHVQWKTALSEKYPHLGERGRPIRTRDDSAATTSMETYTRAELQTYSLKTLSLYHAATLKRLAEGRNEAEENLLNQVRQYGFADLEAAERYFSTRG